MNKDQLSKKVATKSTKPGKAKTRFPAGWDDKRVRQVLDHYEGQTEAERAAEIEAAYTAADQTLISVPNALIPAVLKLVARHQRRP